MNDQVSINSNAALSSVQQISKIAGDWVDAWNMHDLDRIMAHYAEEVEFLASTVVSCWERPGGLLKGRGELRKHFIKGMALAPNIHFDLERLFTSPAGYAVLYRRENGNSVIDTVQLDEFGRAVSVTVYYAALSPDPEWVAMFSWRNVS